MSDPVAVKDTPVEQEAPAPSPSAPPASPENPNLNQCTLADQLVVAAVGGLLACGREAIALDPLRLAKLAWSYADAVLKIRSQRAQ